MRSLKRLPGVMLSPAQVAAITGMYRDAAKGNIARISNVNGKLQWEAYGSTFGLRALNPVQLVPVDFPVDAKLTFELKGDSAGRVMKVSGDPIVEATYQSVAEFAPSAGELAAYAGAFSSDELGVVYRLRLVDGRLTLVAMANTAGFPRTGVAMPRTLRPTITDEFEITDQGVTLHFLKGAGGIKGFNLDAGRTLGIEFTRTAEMENH